MYVNTSYNYMKHQYNCSISCYSRIELLAQVLLNSIYNNNSKPTKAIILFMKQKRLKVINIDFR